MGEGEGGVGEGQRLLLPAQPWGKSPALVAFPLALTPESSEEGDEPTTLSEAALGVVVGVGGSSPAGFCPPLVRVALAQTVQKTGTCQGGALLVLQPSDPLVEW